ncbi:hypothetical protein [Devosia sp. YR412]|uniref:hypothetical protein n=1 Tax=Devosia sp. YR412 TaxID=1881030 RepID=UPI0011146518|nr:hypothetical protein [Devosia sp. YR412]
MSINRQVTTPLSVPRTNRNNAVTVLTSGKAGVCIPLKAIPLLREDAASGRMSIAIEMQETAEILMNPVNVRVSAYLVPTLAFERFEGSMDQFNRSFKGQKKTDDVGAVVVPFVETHAYGDVNSNAFYRTLGLHAKSTDQVSTAYLEAYNLIWNHRANNRSPKITERTRLDNTLAPAFWEGGRFEHIVPKFDAATMDGEVSLNVVNSKMPVHSKHAGVWSGNPAFHEPLSAVAPTGTTNDFNFGTNIWAEMAENGITVSLANIDLARKTQAFAKLREQYSEHDDEWLIDMLMDGLTIPDEQLKHPMLLATTRTKFGMAKRYATDSGSLTESAVSGAAMTSLNIRVPKLHTGGVIMIIAEIAPEQLFERQRDPFFHMTNADVITETGKYPKYLRDTLDPEKVVVVPNGYIDTDHATPNGTFGYAPLNHEYEMLFPNIGGKFIRPAANTGFDEDRQRLWAVETVNPQLAESFYLVKDIHHKPFLDTVSDAFEITMLGNCVINGNTVFGPPLIEASNNYEKVMGKAPMDRIEQGA